MIGVEEFAGAENAEDQMQQLGSVVIGGRWQEFENVFYDRGIALLSHGPIFA